MPFLSFKVLSPIQIMVESLQLSNTISYNFVSGKKEVLKNKQIQDSKTYYIFFSKTSPQKHF